MQLSKELQNTIPFKYAAAVRSGKITTGRKIRLAVDRFYDLINRADDEGYWFETQKGFAVIRFFENVLKHTKGKSARNAFLLSPFQQFTLFNLFAWHTTNEDGEPIRLIRNVFEKMAKKNGKTAVMAGVMLYCLAFDDEAGAEVYIGATKEEQAKLCFDQAAAFIRTNVILQKLGFRVLQNKIIFERNNNKSIGRPLGGDSKTQDGINSHLSIIDEYHAHRDDSVKENLESSSAARKQPITYTITTAGTNPHGVCKNFEDSCVMILEGENVDDTFLIMIHDLDEDDDWEDSANWFKANPNLGVTVSLDFLKKEYQKAKNQPSKIPNFKTKHLNMWVDSPDVWIEAEAWEKCQVEPIESNFVKFGNRGGLDLSTTTDITAYAMISNPDENDIRDLKVWCFCPKDTIEKRSREDAVPYRYWASLLRENPAHENDYYLIATEGNMVDYRTVAAVISEQYFMHGTEWVEYDRKFASGLVTIFQEKNIEMSPFTQTLSNYSSPTKEFERLILSKKIRVGKNPVLKWMLSGCVAISDTNENIRLDKSKSTKRIDGIIASIMALAGTLSEEETNESKYNDLDIDQYLEAQSNE